jgi:hypothetical protein
MQLNWTELWTLNGTESWRHAVATIATGRCQSATQLDWSTNQYTRVASHNEHSAKDFNTFRLQHVTQRKMRFWIWIRPNLCPVQNLFFAILATLWTRMIIGLPSWKVCQIKKIILIAQINYSTQRRSYSAEREHRLNCTDAKVMFVKG